VVLQRRYSHAADKPTGVRSDQTVILATVESARAYPEALRCISVYVLAAIVGKRLRLEASLYQVLQVLSITLYEKTPILRAFQTCDSGSDLLDPGNQLKLWTFSPDSSEIMTRPHLRHNVSTAPSAHKSESLCNA
jgi:hypothetical protein